MISILEENTAEETIEEGIINLHEWVKDKNTEKCSFRMWNLFPLFVGKILVIFDILATFRCFLY